MELPLWLSKGLYERKRRVLSVEMPKVYREGWRTVFTADPNVVDLHKMGPYYYGLGSQLLHFDSPENPDIAQALLQVSRGKNNNSVWNIVFAVQQTKLLLLFLLHYLWWNYDVKTCTVNNLWTGSDVLFSFCFKHHFVFSSWTSNRRYISYSAPSSLLFFHICPAEGTASKDLVHMILKKWRENSC